MIIDSTELKIIGSINDIISVIEKIDKWQAMTNRLSNLLIQKWDQEQRNAINGVIRFLNSGQSEKITKDEFKVAVQELEDQLGARLAQVFRNDIMRAQINAFNKSYDALGIDFQFNVANKKALRWLTEKDVNEFWIGKSYTTDLNNRLNGIASQVLKEGLGREEAGKLFRKLLRDEFTRTQSYWKLLSNHIITRAREFGSVDAYEKAGIEWVKIIAIGDEKTCPICNFLDNKIIKVEKLVEQRDKLLKAKSVKEVKKLARWYTVKQIGKFNEEGKYQESTDIPPGIGTPPYHGHCRCVTEIAYKEEIPQG